VIVVDTSVLIDFLKGTKTAAVKRFSELESDEVPFAIPIVCMQEVLQGARNEKEWRLLDRYLSTQRLLIPQDSLELHREAARIFFDARRRGLTIRSTVDCAIAAQVLSVKGTLLHDDDDFDSIARVRALKTARS